MNRSKLFFLLFAACALISNSADALHCNKCDSLYKSASAIALKTGRIALGTGKIAAGLGWGYFAYIIAQEYKRELFPNPEYFQEPSAFHDEPEIALGFGTGLALASYYALKSGISDLQRELCPEFSFRESFKKALAAIAQKI